MRNVKKFKEFINESVSVDTVQIFNVTLDNNALETCKKAYNNLDDGGDYNHDLLSADEVDALLINVLIGQTLVTEDSNRKSPMHEILDVLFEQEDWESAQSLAVDYAPDFVKLMLKEYAHDTGDIEKFAIKRGGLPDGSKINVDIDFRKINTKLLAKFIFNHLNNWY